MMSPGPDMVLLIKSGVSGSRKAAFACVLGICLSITVHVFFAILGLAALISASTILYNSVRLLGAAYLIFVGIKTILKAKSNDLLSQSETTVVSVGESFREGFFCNLLNPKFTMFLLSIFSQFIGPDSGLTERLVYGSVIILQGLVVWSLFVLVIQSSYVQAFLNKFQVGINRTLGSVLVAFGIAVALQK